MPTTRVCSICKSPNVTKSTCPLNKAAKNKNMTGHVNAAAQIKKYLIRQQHNKSKPHTKPTSKPHTKPTSKQHTKPNTQKVVKQLPRIIVLDNDECLGQFGLFSSLYVYSRLDKDPYKINIEELKVACVKYLFPYGVARPHLLELINLINKLKHRKKIDGLVMYTSAPNNLSDGKSGYVYFLKDCIELYCNCKGVYDKVLHRNNVTANTSSCGATIKDMGNALLTHFP